MANKNLPDYRLIRTKRKSVALIINSNSELIIRAPFKMPLYLIEEIIHKRKEWINSVKLKLKENSNKSQKIFTYGEKFQFLGDSFPLKYLETADNQKNVALPHQQLCFDFSKESPKEMRELSPTQNESIDIKSYISIETGILDKRKLHFLNGTFLISLDEIENAREHFINWYIRTAENYFRTRIEAISEQTGLNYQQMKISNASTRWGSCSSKGIINLNWRLIMASPEIIDYVIIHELAHTKHMNHSKSFWALVGKYCPDHHRIRILLRKIGSTFKI